VTVVQQAFTTLTVPEPLDLIWTSQNYHDLHLARFKLDVASVNRQIFNALKPGGVYVVLDHSARARAEIGVADTLHRIDQAIVRRELEAAGFVYDGELDVLRNPADTRELPVFDPKVRGHTDQFVMRFRRPS
jgi:predicted methyltransferase